MIELQLDAPPHEQNTGHPLIKRQPPISFLSMMLLLSAFLWISSASLYQATCPRYGLCTIQFPGHPALIYNPSTQISHAKTKFVLREDIELSHLYPTVFMFYPQDVLWAIKVNGHEVTAKGLPLSVAHHEGRSIDLAPFLHPGANSIECDMEVYWKQISLNFYISPWDKYSLILSILVLGATLASVAFLRPFFRLTITKAEIAILTGGFLLRYLYLLGTPYFIRAYDWWGHGG